VTGGPFPWPAPVDLGDLLPEQTKGAVQLGLERMEGALGALGLLHNPYPAVHVAGTNGKGSICAMVHGVLAAHGLRCGLYTSPHLVSWCERIRVGQAFITPTTLRALLVELQPLIQRWCLTPFEQLTITALLHFHRQAVDLAVLEVGLGGSLDATTAHGHRPMVAFAAIGEDHQDMLGTDLATIASAKAGVLSPGCVAFSGPQPAVVSQVLHRAARECGARLHWVAPMAEDTFQGLNLPLAGRVQQDNAAVAMAVLQHISATMYPLDTQVIQRGMAALQWPGRLQTCHWQGHPLLVDGAHNRSAALHLRQQVDQWHPHGSGGETHGASVHWVLGILARKDAVGMLQALLRPGDRAWIVAVANNSCWSATALQEHLPQPLARCLQPPPAELGATWTVTGALARAFDQKPPWKIPVVLGGSLYLLGQLYGEGVIQMVGKSQPKLNKNSSQAADYYGEEWDA